MIKKALIFPQIQALAPEGDQLPGKVLLQAQKGYRQPAAIGDSGGDLKFLLGLAGAAV